MSDDTIIQLSHAIGDAAHLLRSHTKRVVLTGAGISTPSGIPDFRSTDNGLWSRNDPLEVASLSAFRYHPERFYQWMRPLAQQITQAKPNPAHFALAQLEQTGYIQAVITQNIDLLHKRAGSQQVIEVHGTMETLSCIGCYEHVNADKYLEAYITLGEIPHCPKCQHILKPDVVLYEEQLPYSTWMKANEFSQSCDLMLIVGSSLEVMPVAGLPMRALEHGAALIIINKAATYIDPRADIILRGDVAELLPMLAHEVFHSK